MTDLSEQVWQMQRDRQLAVHNQRVLYGERASERALSRHSSLSENTLYM